MSNPLSIQAAPPINGSGGTIAPSRASTSLTQSESGPDAKPAQLFVNPSFRFDPTVGIVVIELRDDSGVVTNTIPSQRQLQAYRTHQETPPGEQPPPAPQTVNAKTPAG